MEQRMLAGWRRQSRMVVPAYVFDLLDSKVGVCRDARLLGLYVDDDKERVRRVALEKIVYLEVRGAKLGTGMVPAYQLLAGVDFLEHVVHGLDVVEVQEPDRGIFLIFLEGDC